MSRPKLYLFIGYPGAGKTTTARVIAERTGAVHLWSDAERHKMFGEPTHSEEESLKLYEHLNQRTAELLEQGKSVIFDTNFNFYNDREKLRQIATEKGADTEVIWMTTPVEIAQQRSVHAPELRNGYMVGMTEERFNEIAAKLEPPRDNEKIIKIDGTNLDPNQVIVLLKI